MQYLFSIIAITLMSFFQLNTFFPIVNDDDEDPEEIVLNYQQNGEEPTSNNAHSIHAYYTSSTLYINYSNYVGLLSILVSGSSGILNEQRFVSGSGWVILDISHLSKGNYAITIQTIGVYFGSFDV